MSHRIAIGLLFSLALCASATAQVSKTTQGFLLRSKWKAGDKYEYTMATVAEMNGQKMPFSGSYSVAVQKVSGSTADVLVTGNMPPAGNFSSAAKVDSRGFIGDDPELRDMGARLPEKAVPLGGTWTETKKSSDQGVTLEMTTTYTLRAMRIVDNVPCAVIDVSIKSGGAMGGEGKGTLYYETRNGQLWKSDITMTMSIEAQGTTFNIKSNIAVRRK